MSTLVVGQPDTTTSWKKEVSLRIAAHQNRRGCSMAKQAPPAPAWTAAGSRAAQAAARVAARYAQAPSYSQMLDAAAQATPRAAAIAVSAAPKAPAAAQPVLADSPVDFAVPLAIVPQAVEPVRSTARDREPDAEPLHPGMPFLPPASLQDWENECAHHLLEPDLRLRPIEQISAPISIPIPEPNLAPLPIPVSALAAEAAPRSAEELAISFIASSADAAPNREKWEWQPLADEPWGNEEITPVEPDLPIHANLIEFPRELVATRKMRPRRAEGPYAVQRSQMQLSIFEVDPGAISTHPDEDAAEPVAAWPEPDWSDIKLEPQLHEEAETQELPQEQSGLYLAPLDRRMMAALVDGALVAGIVAGPALVAAAKLGHPPAAKILLLGAVLALLLAGMLYHTLFLMLAGATPGMRCARISLCTFDGQIPTSAQLRSRLGALLLSLVPVGLGVAWALFDDDRLCWHDRLSRTYLRRY